MSDAVSKLYAEIGFKVNQDGLKQAQRFLKSLHTQMSNLNKQTKEMAKQYGIFSKQENAQRREDEKLRREEVKTENERTKGRMIVRKQEFNEKLKLQKEEEAAQRRAYKDRMAADRLIAKHEEEQNKKAEKNAEMRTSRLKGMAGAFKTFAISVSTALVGLTAGVIGITSESRKRALNVRDFQFETGVGFEDLQKYRRQFNIIGSRLAPEDIMNDLASVQQNLVDISLGKGNLSGYKLAGVRASARMGSAAGVMESLRKVATDTTIDNAMLINIMKDMGIKNAGQWLMNFRNVRGDDLRTKETQITADQETQILLAELELKRFRTAVSNAKDQLSAFLAPFIEDIAKWTKTGTENLALFLKELQDSESNLGVWSRTLRGGIDLFKDLIGVLSSIIGVLGKLYTAAANLAEKWGTQIGDWLSNKLGFDADIKRIQDKNSQFMKNLLEAGKSGRLASMKEGFDEFEANTLFGKSVAEAQKYYENWRRMNLQGNVVSQFNNDRRIGNRVQFNNTDNSVQNVTINANGEDEFIEKVADTVEEKQKKKEIRQSEFNMFNDVFVMSGSSGNASVGI